MKLRALIVGFLFIAVPVAAQPPINPTAFTFDHADFAGTTDYEFGYFADATVPAPVQTGTVAKPATCSPCAGTLPARPTAFQLWYVAVRARVGTVAPFVLSEWSVRIPFSRIPVAPVGLTAK